MYILPAGVFPNMSDSDGNDAEVTPVPVLEALCFEPRLRCWCECCSHAHSPSKHVTSAVVERK